MKNDDNFTITEVDKDKKHYLPLLLIGDESEIMIDRYLESGTLYVGCLMVSRLRFAQLSILILTLLK